MPVDAFHLVGQFLASPWAIIAGGTVSVFLLVMLLVVLSAYYQQWKTANW